MKLQMACNSFSLRWFLQYTLIFEAALCIQISTLLRSISRNQNRYTLILFLEFTSFMTFLQLRGAYFIFTLHDKYLCNNWRHLHCRGNNRFLYLSWSKSNQEENGNWQIRLTFSVAFCDIFRVNSLFREPPGVLGCKCHSMHATTRRMLKSKKHPPPA
uniref:Uncharacterized protein n=1 Tax=Salix viminalis TaxID=40686 RepID=A0A6N2MC34_SALVM